MPNTELITQIHQLQARLQLAITEYDDANLHEATAIRVEYTDKIGQFECRQYELYLQFEELKHKIEMIQARVNRGEAVDMNAINNEVADILSAYYEKLSGMRDSVIEMVSFQGGSPINGEDAVELKRLYRKLMKVLHPDSINGALKFDPELWKKAQDAYKRNDLEELILINDMVGETEDMPLETRPESELIDMVKRLELAIARYEMQLKELKKRFPFTEVTHLKNDAWVRARRAEIERNIEQYEQSIAFLAAALSELIDAYAK